MECAVFDALASGLAGERELAQAGLPLGLVRLYNAAESQHVAEPVSVGVGECLLVVTTVGPPAVAAAAETVVVATIEAVGGRTIDASAADPWFARRYAEPGFMADRNRDGERIFDTIEVALPWSAAAACAAELEHTLAPLSNPLYPHLSHVYETGVCLYAILSIAGADAAEAQEAWQLAWSSALELVDHHGGTLAHHHGVGAQRAEGYRRTPEACMHRLIRAACDPAGVLAVPALDSEAALLGLELDRV
jgi:alkyldihydroxyacetonephosphate synthase